MSSAPSDAPSDAAFDTPKAAEALREAGIEEAHAKVIVMRHAATGSVATEGDIAALALRPVSANMRAATDGDSP